MIGPRGGFTAHDRYLGWRGSCACGWVGPWRGSSLTLVEEDVMEHWGKDRCDQGKRGSNSFESNEGSTTMDTTYTSGPGDAQTSRDPADRWRVDMEHDTSAAAIREGEVS